MCSHHLTRRWTHSSEVHSYCNIQTGTGSALVQEPLSFSGTFIVIWHLTTLFISSQGKMQSHHSLMLMQTSWKGHYVPLRTCGQRVFTELAELCLRNHSRPSLLKLHTPLHITIAEAREKIRSAAIKTKEVWEFVQLTFNLDTITWRWTMKEEECEVDYPHSGCQPSEAGIFYQGHQLDGDLTEKLLMPNTAF